jgi:hypothetical protein
MNDDFGVHDVFDDAGGGDFVRTHNDAHSTRVCDFLGHEVSSHTLGAATTEAKALSSPLGSTEPMENTDLPPVCAAGEQHVKPISQKNEREVCKSLADTFNAAHIYEADYHGAGFPDASDDTLGSAVGEPACSARGGCVVDVPNRTGLPRVKEFSSSGLNGINPAQCPSEAILTIVVTPGLTPSNLLWELTPMRSSLATGAENTA